MSDTVTIKLTRAQKAAAERLADKKAGKPVAYYDRCGIANSACRKLKDRSTLAAAVLAAMQKGGA